MCTLCSWLWILGCFFKTQLLLQGFGMARLLLGGENLVWSKAFGKAGTCRALVPSASLPAIPVFTVCLVNSKVPISNAAPNTAPSEHLESHKTNKDEASEDLIEPKHTEMYMTENNELELVNTVGQGYLPSQVLLVLLSPSCLLCYCPPQAAAWFGWALWWWCLLHFW